MILKKPMTVPMAILMIREALSLAVNKEDAALFDVGEVTGNGRAYLKFGGDRAQVELPKERFEERAGARVGVVATIVELSHGRACFATWWRCCTASRLPLPASSATHMQVALIRVTCELGDSRLANPKQKYDIEGLESFSGSCLAQPH